jgi:repressor LexA
VNGIREVSVGLDDVVAAPRCNVYAAVRDFLRASDRPPTVRDVHYAVELKFSYWMKVLRPEGWERSHGNPALHMEADDLPREVGLPSQIGATVMVPVYGWIPGGPLDLPNQAFEGAFLLDKPAFGAGTLFMFQVVGNSMIKAGIADGNWVVVRQQEVARDGDIVAAMVGGEVTVKTLHRERGLLELVPQNPDYEPISVTELTILGKVVGVVRQT